MAREIKFRAWVKTQEKMIEVDQLGLIEGARNCRGSGPNGATYYGDTFVLMQFTGLLDKNGKEIYEGDILSPTFGHDPEAVTFEDGRFSTHYGFSKHTAKVIGNIYENPELFSRA